jgi:imidazolonepropionase-like amidohydrolase
MSSSLLIAGATIIDGVSDKPLEGLDVWIEGTRIAAIGRQRDFNVPPDTQLVDARGKFVIPGLMDANVHLLLDMRLENLVRYENRYEDLIAEAAQVALKNGVTTVFDTWGPRRHLVAVRDRIANGEIVGSRIFCAGNIVGLDGPCSADFLGKSAEVASAVLVQRINSIWAENVGPELTWMSPQQVAEQVRAYIAAGDIDFIKYASSEHRVPTGPSAFLAFSPQCQRAIVEEAQRAGLTAQAHAQSVEAVRISAQAGCEIIQHCNVTGPVPLPEATLELLVENKTASTVFPLTKRRYEWFNQHGDVVTSRIFTQAAVETNVRNLIRSGATILLATDAGILAAESSTDAALGAVYSGDDNLFELGEGHFHWLTAMEENGLAPMEMLRAATRNIAAAYRKGEEFGTVEPRKVADILVLDKNPLLSAANYRSINMVIKNGSVVDRSRLPSNRLLTAPPEPFADVSPLRMRPPRVAALPSCC